MESVVFAPNNNPSFLGNRRILLSAKIQQHQRLTRTWVIMMRSREHMQSSSSQFNLKPIPKVIESSQVAKDQVDSTADHAVEEVKKIEDLSSFIKSVLSKIEDGRISVSPYDTAWIALIRKKNELNIPQFPTSIEWIVQHQLADGSWGDEHFFSIYDRLLNTIACVIALKSWNVHAHKIEKGISYVKKNIWKLEDARDVHMTCGFEVIFPALLRRARDVGIDDIPIMEKIYSARDRKLKKIPREVMHQVTTTLLYSLEGLEDLDWSRLLKLQSADGSFFTSPSSTAFAFMETNDPNCLKFITNIVQQFNGGAPHTYPVDLFARLWVVDRLQCLGISRFFESEINDFLSYVYSFSPQSILMIQILERKRNYSARNINFSDIDCTSMAFRLLRLQGYDVDQNVISKFKDGDVFCCHIGEVSESTTPMYALYRASQIRFQGEEILEEAYHFSYNFLQNWLGGDQLLDKWIVPKDLPNEIQVGLDVPWYASLPRVATAYYLHHYGGSSELWIAKTLYRMPDIDNDDYLELARLDFKRSQSQHQIEWSDMLRWYENGNYEEFGISKKELLLAYFLAAATIFEPERAKERIVWAKSQLISRMVRSFFIKEPLCLKEFRNDVVRGVRKSKSAHQEINILLEAIYELSQGFDEGINRQLQNVWGLWLSKLGDETIWEDAELIVTTLNTCGAHFSESEDILLHHHYITLSNLVNKICRHLCRHLSQIPNKKAVEMRMYGRSTWKDSIKEIDADMQELTKLVLLKQSSVVTKNMKQTFLSVAKTFYYTAYFDAQTIDLHIFKLLFDQLI